MTQKQAPVTEFDKTLGLELRAVRERLGLTRLQAVARLRELTGTDISDRALLTYEHGIRNVTVARLVELATTYGIPAPLILGDALRRLAGETACPTCGREP